MKFYKPYNLSNLKKDLINKPDKTIALFSDHNLDHLIYKFNFKSQDSFSLLPESKLNNLGLCQNSIYYYYEELNSAYTRALASEELKTKILSFLAYYKDLLTDGNFYFHGSALTSLVLEHLFKKRYTYADINFLAQITALNSHTHKIFYKFPRPNLSDRSVNYSFAFLGSRNIGSVCFDYILSPTDDLNLLKFIQNQPFNYSEIYFNLKTKELQFGAGFLDFLETLTIKIKPKFVSLNSFLQAHRISALWKMPFYYKDYLPFFASLYPVQGLKGEINFLKKDHYQGILYKFDSVAPSTFELTTKNFDFYLKDLYYPWLTKGLKNNSFLINFAHSDFNLPFSPEDSSLVKLAKVHAAYNLYITFNLNYLTLPSTFFTNYKNYLEAGNFQWEERDSSFWKNFIFEWRKISPQLDTSKLQMFFNSHNLLRPKLFEMARYRSISEAWSFFSRLLNFPKRKRAKFLRFIGYLENHLSLAIHNAPKEVDLFNFLYTEFLNSSKSQPDRFLTFPLILPWYLKKLVKELKTSKELELEGNFMNHCVSGYDVKVENNLCRIFHLETGMGHSTLEIDSKFNIIQHRGYANNMPRSRNIKLSELLVRNLKKNYSLKQDTF